MDWTETAKGLAREAEKKEGSKSFCNEGLGAGKIKNMLVKGNKYNWINQRERLIYLGENFSGNGYWHQFAKVETPDEIWCECLDSDLDNIEETQSA